LKALRGKPEITRFKGLGEISPDEFVDFIGPDIRLENVHMADDVNIDEVLTYYMGKNTPERQEFIIDNLKVSLDHLPVDLVDAHATVEEIAEDAGVS